MDDCPICLEKMSAHVCTTPCGHVFHSECVFRALRRNHTTCPVCRASLVTDADESLTSFATIQIDVQARGPEQRRQVRNYDARRRRYEARNELARIARDKAKAAHDVVVQASRRYERTWEDAVARVRDDPDVKSARRERALAIRRLRMAKRSYHRLVVQHLGERPVAATRAMAPGDLAAALAAAARLLA